jgi:hypothetical protein
LSRQNIKGDRRGFAADSKGGGLGLKFEQGRMEFVTLIIAHAQYRRTVQLTQLVQPAARCSTAQTHIFSLLARVRPR